MLKEDYSDMIRAASRLLSDVMLTRVKPLVDAGPALDVQVQAVLRELGLQLMTHLLDALGRELSAAARHRGYLTRARKRVTFKVLFGAVEVESPQLRHRDSGHLKSHVWDTAVETGMAEPIAKRWMTSIMERLHQGDAAGVLDQLRIENEHDPHERRTRLIGYLTRFEHAVHYDEYRAQGWPIGSGEVESAHRYILQERLKIAGATWHPDNVNPMLSLRVVRANGWWDDLWQWRAQRAAA